MLCFCENCEACSCRCSCIGSMSVSSYRCMFVSCVHPVAVLNDAFCMTCSLYIFIDFTHALLVCVDVMVISYA